MEFLVAQLKSWVTESGGGLDGDLGRYLFPKMELFLFQQKSLTDYSLGWMRPRRSSVTEIL